jgi:hypothetical protein
MIGKIFITRSGYDPQLGKHVKDPYLGANPTLGAYDPPTKPRRQWLGHGQRDKGATSDALFDVRYGGSDRCHRKPPQLASYRK